jgi:hypothetical protein
LQVDRLFRIIFDFAAQTCHLHVHAALHAGRVAEREASAALRERVRHIFEQVGPEAVKGSVAVIEAMAHFKDKPD